MRHKTLVVSVLIVLIALPVIFVSVRSVYYSGNSIVAITSTNTRSELEHIARLPVSGLFKSMFVTEETANNDKYIVLFMNDGSLYFYNIADGIGKSVNCPGIPLLVSDGYVYSSSGDHGIVQFAVGSVYAKSQMVLSSGTKFTLPPDVPDGAIVDITAGKNGVLYFTNKQAYGMQSYAVTKGSVNKLHDQAVADVQGIKGIHPGVIYTGDKNTYYYYNIDSSGVKTFVRLGSFNKRYIFTQGPRFSLWDRDRSEFIDYAIDKIKYKSKGQSHSPSVYDLNSAYVFVSVREVVHIGEYVVLSGKDEKGLSVHIFKTD